MDPIEKAIRSAFEKGNPDDRDFREKVYRAAFAALDRALKANPNLTVEAAINRRKALQAKITEIESEFQPAVPSIDPVSEGARGEPSLDDVRPGRRQATPDLPGERRNGAPAAKASRGQRAAAKRDERRARRSRFPFAGLLGTLVVLAALGLGGWWVWQAGLLKPRGVGAGGPARVVQDQGEENDGAPMKPGQADPNRAWIDVFSPADASSVTAPGEATADVMQDGSGSFLRIRSGGSDAAVLFDVGQGVLERLAGKRATFDIVARGAEGKETQMSVECNFGELGGCGRKRYAVSADQGDYLFELDFRSQSPGAGGTIAINSDVAGQGKAIDIYEIRVSVAQ